MTPLRDLLAEVHGEDDLTVGAAAILDLQRLGVNVAEIDRNRERYRRALVLITQAESLEDARRMARLAIAGWAPAENLSAIGLFVPDPTSTDPDEGAEDPSCPGDSF